MKSFFSFILLFSICSFVGCSNDDMEMQETVDIEGPEFTRITWIDNPGVENDPTGDIIDGSNHTISIESGFQLLIDVRDENNIVEGDVYFTINNDPTIKEILFSPSLIIDNQQSGVRYVYRVDKISFGTNEWYLLQPGDTYQFSARFTDEFGNENSMTWTADIVE